MAKTHKTTAGKLEFFVRCASGFEPVLADELRALHMERVRPLQGGVAFFGELVDGYRACLWSRIATRVQLVLARVGAVDAKALYAGVRGMTWEDLVQPQATIAVDAHGTNNALRNTAYIALKVKDALCDRLKEVQGARPNVDARNPDFAVNVALHQQKATLYLNLSGASLHRRGYRKDGVQTEAPLKETLAAGMLLAAGWPSVARKGGVLVDPMCGSGTLAIEAALIAADVAPGLQRDRWGFEGWLGHDANLWSFVRKQAEEMGRRATPHVHIVAGDLDARAIDIARANARRAHVESLIEFFEDDARNVGRHLRGVIKNIDVAGLMVANPPYGQRLLTSDDLVHVREAVSMAVDSLPCGWNVALISPDAGIDSSLGRVPERLIECHNGPIAVWIRVYDTSRARQTAEVVSLAGVRHEVPIADSGSTQFVARLRKVARERMRWARREDISCLRLYDADLPEYALTVELYQEADASGARYALIEEHRRPKPLPALKAGRRFADATALTAAVLDLSFDSIVARQWVSSRDSGARHEGPHEPLPLVVEEQGLHFEIDLWGKPDTGLPLVLRGVRQLVGELSASQPKDACFANLCAASGAATAYAVRAGMTRTVSVDSFADRVEWVRRSLRSNELGGTAHQFVREDMRTWVEQEIAARHKYSLLLFVPPAWMAARKQDRHDWELQRDHAGFLLQMARICAKGGTIVFVAEQRGFGLDKQQLVQPGFAVRDVSSQTLPHDFERSVQEHHCYLLSK